MGIETAQTLYLSNGTVVDSGTGIDVRLLTATAPGANDDTQTAQFVNTNDNVERTFDPASTAVTNTNNAGTTLFKAGYALRLSQDMTPADDTNCDAVLTDQALTVNFQAALAQSGGTYVSGTVTPTFRASLWRYNPATDTGTLIAAGSSNSVSWNVAAVGGDLGTFKAVSVPITIASKAVFSPGAAAAEVLYLQIGFNTGTVPDPTLGTGTFTMTLRLGPSTSLNFASGQGIRTICPMQGSTSGLGAAQAPGITIKPTAGSASGVGVAAGQLQATGQMQGSAAGLGTALAPGSGVAQTRGSSAGVGTAAGRLAAVLGTVGTATVGGGTTIIRKRVLIFD